MRVCALTYVLMRHAHHVLRAWMRAGWDALDSAPMGSGENVRLRDNHENGRGNGNNLPNLLISQTAFLCVKCGQFVGTCVKTCRKTAGTRLTQRYIPHANLLSRSTVKRRGGRPVVCVSALRCSMVGRLAGHDAVCVRACEVRYARKCGLKQGIRSRRILETVFFLFDWT